MEPLVRFEDAGSGVGLIEICRPEAHNALNRIAQDEFSAALAQAGEDPSIRCLVVAGAGGRALSAGWDIHEMTSLGTEENLALTTEREEWLWRWYAHPLPTVAAVQGIAYGVGSYLAVCADLRVGGPATKLKVTGMSYGYAALTWALPDLIGTSRAKDMLFTGQAVDGARAAEIGLLNRYVGDDEVRSQAIALAAEVAALPGNAVRDAKRLMREAPGRPARIRYDTENVLSREGLRTQGAAELMRPFTERKSRAD